MKHCPHCDGLIQDGAIKCKHCKQFVNKENEERIRENEKIFQNITKEEVRQESRDVIWGDYKNDGGKYTLQEEKAQVDIRKIVAISVIGISIFILLVYMLVSFIKTQNIENKTSNNPPSVAIEKLKEIKTDTISPISTTSTKTEEEPKEEKRGEMKKILQDVNLRSESTSSSEKIHTIYEGDEVEVLGKITNSQGYLWYKVKHEGVEGWISYVGFEKKEEEKTQSKEKNLHISDIEGPFPYNYVNKYRKGNYYYLVMSANGSNEVWECNLKKIKKYQISGSELIFVESRITRQKYALAQEAPEYPQKDCQYLGTGPTQAQIVGESVGF